MESNLVNMLLQNITAIDVYSPIVKTPLWSVINNCKIFGITRVIRSYYGINGLEY